MIVDTDVLIWYMRGDEKAMEKLRRLGGYSISAVTLMELIQGMRNKRELAGLMRYLRSSEIKVIAVSEKISDRALFYMERYFLGHNLRIADALIGATAQVTGEVLLSGNARHYRVLKDIKLAGFKAASQ